MRKGGEKRWGKKRWEKVRYRDTVEKWRRWEFSKLASSITRRSEEERREGGGKEWKGRTEKRKGKTGKYRVGDEVRHQGKER